MQININRDKAEWLITLLEKDPIEEVGTWQVEFASDLRKSFGMCQMCEMHEDKITD